MIPPAVRTVCFDAVGTLFHPAEPVAETYARVGHKYGSRLSAAEIGPRFRSAFRAEEERDRRDGWRTDEGRELQRWRTIVATVLDDVAEPEACLAELYEHFALPGAWECTPGTAEVLADLARRGFGLALASNYDHRLHAVVRGVEALRAIRDVVVSSEVGWRKPAPEFFAALTGRLGCEPGQLLLVGDDLENDFEGARAAGLHALLLTPGEPRGPGLSSLRELF